MEKIINKPLFKWFRKQFLIAIYKAIKSDNTKCCCCWVKTYHRFFICWKDLKEVKENMSSEHLRFYISNNVKKQNCNQVWFSCKEHRLDFLKQCINKFSNKNYGK